MNEKNERQAPANRHRKHWTEDYPDSPVLDSFSAVTRTQAPTVGAEDLVRQLGEATGCIETMQREIDALKEELHLMSGFANLWYFVMDEEPLAFERIVTEMSSQSWMDEAAKLRRGKRK